MITHIVERIRGRIGFYGVVIYLSTILSITLLVGSGEILEWGEWYAPHLTLRQQTDSLMEGRLGLSEEVSAVRHDHVWDNGRVQQVWGLGVPAWRLPFEVISRLLERPVFPDRIAFGVAVALVSGLVIRAFLAPAGSLDIRSWGDHLRRHWETGVAPFLLVLFPPFLNLLSAGRFTVYEEVQAYSYLAGIGILAGVMLFLREPRLWLFLVVSAMGGLAAFVRPTAGIFGIAALVVLLIRGYGLRWSLRRLGAGVALFLVGGVLLYVANWIRFGAGFEFGHYLNLNDGHTMRFAGRFEAPYQSEPFFSAWRELGSLLFVEDGYRSDTLRWRQIYFRGFNLSYLPPLLIACVWSGCRFWRMFRKRELSFGEGDVLGFWCIVCSVPLLLFYLRCPFINSRYLLDFAPGFAAGILAFVYLLRDWGVRRFGSGFRWAVVAGVVLWWGWQVLFATEFGTGRIWDPAITREELTQRMGEGSREFRAMPEVYEAGMPVGEYVGMHNGSGWNSNLGNTRASIALFVDDPEFVEFTVAPAEGVDLSPEDYEIIQAKVGLEFLELESVTPAEEGMMVRFAGPERKRYQTGIQVVFAAFMTAEEVDGGNSRFRLLRVRWKGNEEG